MRLIDADALIKRMPSVMDMQDVYLPIHFKELLIDDAPTVDAVPLVRCKDCARNPKYTARTHCPCYMDRYMGPDGWCSMARRKEDNGKK